MTEDEAKRLLIEEIGVIAPDADPSGLQPDDDLRDRLDLNSMDILNLVMAIHERTGIDIPEIDYPRMYRWGSAIDYLVERAARPGG
ncbi:MAG: phosphopantetheine-binding protein [Thalassobaculum sp.]